MARSKKKVTLFLVGDGVLREKLARLTDAETKKVIRAATRDALKPVAQAAKALAPKRTGALARSMRVRALARSKKRIGSKVTTSSQDSAFKGYQFYGAFQEYGWKAGKRKANKDIGLRRRKRRNADMRAKIDAANGTRKQIEGKFFLKRAADQNRELAIELFNRAVDDHIKKIMSKRS